MVRKTCCNPFSFPSKAHNNKKYVNVTPALIEKIHSKGGKQLCVGDTICSSCTSKAYNNAYSFAKPTTSGLTECSTTSSVADVSHKSVIFIFSTLSS